MSAAARKRISDAQKQRWKKFHSELSEVSSQNLKAARKAYKKKHAKKKFTMSPVSRKKISEARKAYWADRKKKEAAAERDE